MLHVAFVVISILISIVPLYGTEAKFGYISYTSFNIGDDVQALAAQQFLPKNAIGIDREFIGVFRAPTSVHVLVNGWFMHTKKFCWYRSDVPAPEKSWPPSSSIHPLFLSIHFTDGFMPEAFSEEAVAYLHAHAPIGARDLNTLHELQSRGINSYFSGCLTLTLNNEKTSRNQIIYAVDLDDACFNYLKSRVKGPIERLTHSVDEKMARDPEARLRYTNELLNKYKEAKAVVTTRLHATMPCLAFETPVLFIADRGDTRLHGLRELARNCNRTEFLFGEFDFNFHEPSKNPPQYLELRKNLIKIVKNWAANCQQSGNYAPTHSDLFYAF